MMRFTQRIWTGENGVGRAAARATTMVRIAPMFVDSWKRTSFTRLS
jgi:hypothetical protein